jgi:hypothetical protein
MTDYDIHSCGYYCDRHACIVAQRNELRDKLFEGQAVKTYSGGKPNYTQPDEALMKQVMDGIPDMPIKVQDKSFEEFAQGFAQSARVNGIPEPEPVGWLNPNEKEHDGYAFSFKNVGVFTNPVYAKPQTYAPSENNLAYERGYIDGQQKQIESAVHKAVNAMGKKEWVGLTEDEAQYLFRLCLGRTYDNFWQAIEAKLKEKNGG